ncbi:MAG: tol-pal system YbgF family protein [Bradymonadaceae bacterium]
MAINIRKKGDDEEPTDDRPEDAPDVAPGEADPFIDNSVRTFAWLADNRNLVFGVLAGLVGVGIAAYAAMQYTEQQAVSASNKVSKPIRLSEVPVDGSPRLKIFERQKQIKKPDKTFASLDEKWSKVFKKASSAAEAVQGSSIGPTAQLTLAGAALRHGKYQKAISAYQSYLKSNPPKKTRAIVFYGLAAAYAGAEKYKKARKALDDMVKADDQYKSLAQYQKGILYQHAGNKKKAKQMFHKALETDPKTPYKSDIKRRIALLS